MRDSTTDPKVEPGTWTRLAIPAAEFGLQPGDRLDGVTLAVNGGVIDWDRLCLAGEADRAADPLESFTAWRRALGQTVPPDLPGELHPLIQGGPEKQFTADELETLQTHYLSVVARPSDPDLMAARRVWDAAREARILADESAIRDVHLWGTG